MIFITRFWNNDSTLPMIKNSFLFLCGFMMITTLLSCNDDNFLGSSIQPGKDKLSIAYDTFGVKTQSVIVDSIYLRNSLAALGEFTDPTFGTTKSDYMAQLYCARNFQFPDDVSKVDSAFMYIYYSGWYGDSTGVHHAKVYELNKPLDISNTYYSNTNPSDYIDWTNPKLIGQGAFASGDIETSDSIKKLSTYSRSVRIPINLTLANRFLQDSKTSPSKFATPEAFLKYFNGIYVTTDYGNSSLLYVSHTEIELCYGTWLYSTTTGLRDSFIIGASYFPSTKEVKQINMTKHVDLSQYLKPSANDSLNYIYAPAGMFTRVTIPDSLFTKNSGLLSGKTVSSMRLRVMASVPDDDNPWKYAIKPPSTLLLVNEDSVQRFFSKFEMPDGLNTFAASYDSTNLDYSFNMSYYAQKMIREKDSPGSTNLNPFTKMLLIPVSIVTNTDGDQVRLENVISPAAVKIRSGTNSYQPMRLEVIYSKEGQ